MQCDVMEKALVHKTYPILAHWATLIHTVLDGIQYSVNQTLSKGLNLESSVGMKQRDQWS